MVCRDVHFDQAVGFQVAEVDLEGFSFQEMDVNGIAGALAHSLSDPASVTPMVGASGAIAGVLGAYLLLHPHTRVLVLVLYRVPIRLPAYIVLGGWVLLQVFNVYAGGSAAGGTAWWAHIGGFATGVLLIVPLRRKGLPLFGGGGK